MNRLAQERLAVVIVGGILAASRLIAPTWTIHWRNGLVSDRSHWIWARPGGEAVESARVDWFQTSVPVVGAALAVVFLWWLLGLGRQEGERSDVPGDASGRRH